MINLYTELCLDFQEITPQEFYRTIFPIGELDTKDSYTKGKYTGIACEFCGVKKSNGKELVKRYSITDDLEVIDDLLKSDNFIIISPISYIGKKRTTENARYMYAFAIEIDNLKKRDEKQVGYNDLLHQMDIDLLPRPTFIVASGNGLHLYYVFEKPLVLFPNVKKSLKNYKKAITRSLWNRYITTDYQEENIQYESAFQGFRMVGGVTKNKERTKVFRVSDKPVSIEYMNSFVSDDEDKIGVVYKSDLSLAEAKVKYPYWYEKRVVNKQPKGSWVVKRDLYDWWLRKLKNNEAKVGHRYYCLMILCVYAIKCDISREELEKDCYSLVDKFDAISLDESNRFTIKDMADALQSFEDKGLITYPLDVITKRSGIDIKKNKRNGRSQEEHIKLMNFVRDEINGNKEWRNKEGRPVKAKIVEEWRKNNPDGKKIDCERETGLSRPTVLKWWNYENDKTDS